MNQVTVGILGFLTIIAIVVTLFKSKTLPSIAFILFPSILALILVFGGYYTFKDVASLIKDGFKSTGPTAALFVFSVLFFGIMTDAGLFDVIIGKLMKLVGDNVIGVTVMTAIIAIIGHLDGGGDLRRGRRPGHGPVRRRPRGAGAGGLPLRLRAPAHRRLRRGLARLRRPARRALHRLSRPAAATASSGDDGSARVPCLRVPGGASRGCDGAAPASVLDHS